MDGPVLFERWRDRLGLPVLCGIATAIRLKATRAAPQNLVARHRLLLLGWLAGTFLAGLRFRI